MPLTHFQVPPLISDAYFLLLLVCLTPIFGLIVNGWMMFVAAVWLVQREANANALLERHASRRCVAAGINSA